MSKKRGKVAPKKASKMKASNMKAKAIRRPAARATAAGATDAADSKTVYATIFIYRTGNGNRIRTSPQRLYANPNDRIEWTVVNLVDGSDVPARITWPAEGPWGKEPLEFRGSHEKRLEGAKAGRFKYVVSALDAVEDPEIEIPEM
jgi:hypothetical protein